MEEKLLKIFKLDNPLLKWDNVIELFDKYIENLKDTV